MAVVYLTYLNKWKVILITVHRYNKTNAGTHKTNWETNCVLGIKAPEI